MITSLSLIILGLLIISSLFDLKYKAIPSVLLTAGIFVSLVVNPHNLIFGVICLVFALMIKDLVDNIAGSEFGVADIKIFVIFGLLLVNIHALFIMVVVFLIFQFAYTMIWRWQVDKKEEIPFIPCLLAVYVVLLILGYVA